MVSTNGPRTSPESCPPADFSALTHELHPSEPASNRLVEVLETGAMNRVDALQILQGLRSLPPQAFGTTVAETQILELCFLEPLSEVPVEIVDAPSDRKTSFAIDVLLESDAQDPRDVLLGLLKRDGLFARFEKLSGLSI